MIFMFGLISTLSAQESYSQDTILMGSSFRFTALNKSNIIAQQSVNLAIEEVIRIEKLISSWDDFSQTSQINRMAGVSPVKVSIELLLLIERTLKISEISNGYFDISFASIDQIWNFTDSISTIPTQLQLEQSVEKINYKNISIDKKNTTIFLLEKGMKIGFGSIGKGYAANRAKMIMVNNGIKSGVVNAGGDLIAWGTKENNKLWSIGVVDPFNKNETTLWLDVDDMAVVTSGNYEKYLTINGKRYCHIVNPKTGWPVSGLVSVTIMCRDAELADALATTVFVLGLTDGLNLINHLEGVEGVLISENGSMHYSHNLKK
jgi:thiamine biosynthesis lipoprotein